MNIPGVDELIAGALAEDLGSGDVTTQATVPAGLRATGTISQKAPGVLYGLDLAARVFAALDPGCEIDVLCQEGHWREGGDVLAVTGSARGLLSGERTALNFLQQLSGVATATALAVREVQGTSAQILDTRKTIPGLRLLQKAAVLAGGAVNHRVGLYDAILIKDNHIAIAGGVAPAIERARAAYPALDLEVECTTVSEVDEALAAGATHLLLDNMDPSQLREVVERVAGRAVLEASGNITVATIAAHARSGVEFISLGALTHSAPALDLSFRMEAI